MELWKSSLFVSNTVSLSGSNTVSLSGSYTVSLSGNDTVSLIFESVNSYEPRESRVNNVDVDRHTF
jgi:hypothetical protein